MYLAYLLIVSHTGVPEEHLVAMVESDSSTGESLTKKLLEVLSELGLGLEQLIGQGYDGGSNMRGEIQGVQARIKDICPRALYTWCWSHSLQLVMSHAAEESVAAVDCFRKIKEVYACVSSSAHRTKIMEQHLLGISNDLLVDEEVIEETELKHCEEASMSVGDTVNISVESLGSVGKGAKVEFHKEHRYRRMLSISGTRFIARTRNLRIFHKRLSQIKEALIEMGLQPIANSLDARFHITVSALYTILCPISDLSQALQNPELNLLGAQQHLDLLSTQLKLLRTDAAHDKLIAAAKLLESSELALAAEKSPDTSLPALSNAIAEETRRPQRKRCLPADFNDSIVMHALPIFSTSDRSNSTLHKQEYYELIDLIDKQIESRFDNPALSALASLQSGQMTPSLAEFCTLHGRDIDVVERQLTFTSMSLLASLPSGSHLQLTDLFCATAMQPDLHYMTDVALTLPVTSSNAERAFSRLRLIKDHLRTTMSAARLQSLLRLSANKSYTVLLPLEKMLQEFVKCERKLAF